MLLRTQEIDEISHHDIQHIEQHLAHKDVQSMESVATKRIHQTMHSLSQKVKQKRSTTKGIVQELTNILLETGANDNAAVLSYQELQLQCKERPGRYAMVIFTFCMRGENANRKLLEQTIDSFQTMAAGMLRGHDMVVPHGYNRVLVVMPNHSSGTAHQIKKRLYNSFKQTAAAKEVHSQAEVAEIRPAKGILRGVL